MVGEGGSKERRKVGLSIVIFSLRGGVIAATSYRCVGSLGCCIVEIGGVSFCRDHTDNKISIHIASAYPRFRCYFSSLSEYDVYGLAGQS